MKRRLKKLVLIIAILLITFFVYVAVVNRNSKRMTNKQKVLKAVYPALMWYNKLTGKKSSVMENSEGVVTLRSLHNLSIRLNDGTEMNLGAFKGKKILIVNTASNCGYTNQYEGLQQLYEQFKDCVTVIAFPANDFKEQEKGSDQEIAEFCRINYGVSFPIATKSSVVKGKQQNEVFKWLSTEDLNGWNDQEPTWNFFKYLVDEDGKLIKYFDTGVSPLSDEVVSAIRMKE